MRQDLESCLFWLIIFINIDIYYVMSIIIDVMGRKKVVLLPQTEEILKKMGEQIKFARLRRKLSVELVAERAGVSRATIWAVEKGAPSVAMGIYASVLLAIGMQEDLLLIAKDDVLGRTLQDLGLPLNKRAPKRRKTEAN